MAKGQPVRVVISGFGRIGRLVLRAALERNDDRLEIIAINDPAAADTSVHLLNFDSTHGRLQPEAVLEGDVLRVGGRRIKMLQQKDPAALPWRELDVDLVLECSGRFTDREGAAKHLAAGAKKVLISAPATGEDYTVVYGVNDDGLTDEHKIVSNGSCTTNCLAPVAKAIHDAVGIRSGFVTTVHSYTADQRVVDTDHADLSRARAAGANIIPTSTGAAKAIGKVLPELAGRLDGIAMRVPTPNVSEINFVCSTDQDVTIEKINAALAAAAARHPDVVAVTDKKLVSSDFNHDSHSVTVALGETRVTGGNLVHVLGWYDNEWGFSSRMLDVALRMGPRL